MVEKKMAPSRPRGKEEKRSWAISRLCPFDEDRDLLKGTGATSTEWRE